MRLALWFAAAGGIAVFCVRFRQFLYESAYFEVRQVSIQGVSPEVEERMKQQIRFEDLGSNLLYLSTDALREKLLAVPEVGDASIRCIYPERLEITARERYPVAVLAGERSATFDSQGVAVEFLSGEDFLNSLLPIVSADPAPKVVLGERIADERILRAWGLLSLLRQEAPDIAVRISETHVGPDGDVTLFFDGGAEARLGRREPADILPVFEAFWEQMDGLDGIEYAELRFRDQVAFKRRGAALEAKASAKTSEEIH